MNGFATPRWIRKHARMNVPDRVCPDGVVGVEIDVLSSPHAVAQPRHESVLLSLGSGNPHQTDQLT